MKFVFAIFAFSAFPCSVICQPGSQYDRQDNLINNSQASSSRNVKPKIPPKKHPGLPHNAQRNFQYNILDPDGARINGIIYRTMGTDTLFYRDEQLFFTDNSKKQFCVYHDLIKHLHCTTIGRGSLSFVVPVNDNFDRFLVGYNNKVTLIYWDYMINSYSNIEKTYEEMKLKESVELNNGIGDPFGGLCFWTVKRGKTDTGKVWLYHPRYPQPHLKELTLPGVVLSNGVIWYHRDSSRLFCIDTVKNTILSFVYFVTDSKIHGDPYITFELDKWIAGLKAPLYDGYATLGRMTLDSRNRIWVPLYGGSHVLQINPRTSEVLQAIYIPAARVVACVFGGGKKMDTLYVSTLGYDANEKRPAGDLGGTIFEVTNLGHDVKGFEALTFHLPN